MTEDGVFGAFIALIAVAVATAIGAISYESGQHKVCDEVATVLAVAGQANAHQILVEHRICEAAK